MIDVYMDTFPICYFYMFSCQGSCDCSSPDAIHPRVQFITANVGSIFEKPENLFNPWIEQVFDTIAEHQPKFVAIHFQEAGNKNY